MVNNYKDAGVDVEAGYESVKLIKNHVEKTFTKNVLTGLGGFAGLYDLGSFKYENPVLVSGTDGVGTKLKIAFMLDKHDTIGIDCVAMCVNDIICCGATPLFFLDYIALDKNRPHKVEQIVKGVADGCYEAGCSLIGGETAEMPGFYTENEYDLAGFAVGIADKAKMLLNTNVKAGDTLVAVKSSGVHSNGFSLVRKVIDINEYSQELGRTLGEELLTPTRIYVKYIKDVVEKGLINSVSHITGGGFIENIPRMLPGNLRAKIILDKVQVLPIFEIIQKHGNISREHMYNVFNMGVGLVMATSKPDEVLATVPDSYVVGEVTEGENGVDLC